MTVVYQLLGFVGVMAASSAFAQMPPAPPLPAVADSLIRFTTALRHKNAASYETTLADDVKVIEDGKVVSNNKVEWMRSIRNEFSRSYRTIKIDGLWQGFTGTPAFHAMILEEDNEMTKSCCSRHRVEILTFRGDKVVRIELSPSLDTDLTLDGVKFD